MAQPLHRQPPAIQLFCENFADGVIDFYRHNPSMAAITSVALTAIAVTAFAALPVIFPAAAIMVTVAEIGTIAAGCIGGLATAILLPEGHPWAGLALSITFLVLGIMGSAAIAVMIPGVVGLGLAEAAVTGVCYAGSTPTIVYTGIICGNICDCCFAICGL